MSELPDQVPPAVEPVPRDSALGILVRRVGPGLEVLLGRRSGASRFLPGHLAFPGGRLESCDGEDRDHALRRCASREFREETGIDVAPDRWIPVGDRTTPPIFPVRFLSRFFVAEAAAHDHVPDEPPQREEIEALVWASPAAILGQWQAGAIQVPPPVLPLLRALEGRGGAAVEEIAAELAAVNASEQADPRIEFVPGIWMLPLRTRTLPPATHTNAWIPGGTRSVVVDPGSDDPAELARLRRVLDRRAAAGAPPAAVVLTHHHGDHSAGAAALAAALSVPLRAHRWVLDRLGLAGQPLRDGEVLDLGGLTLRAHETPGHAPGHLALEVPERGALIAGDLVSAMSTILILPGYGDMTAYLESLERMAELGLRTLLPAHGPPSPPVLLLRTAAHRREREDQVRAALGRDPLPLPSVAQRAYADTPQVPARLAEMQTLAHLEDLERRGLARRDGDGRWGPARS